jgi:hypothetical protein
LFLFGLSSHRILYVPIVISILIGAMFIVVEFRVAKDPIIPVMVLKSQGVLFTCLATLGSMMSRWTILFYTPVYGIAIRDWSPAFAGSLLIPTNLGFAIGGVVVGWIHLRKAGSYYV